MSGKNVLKLDRDSITKFQKELYNGDKNNPLIGTRFSVDVEKRAQGNHIKVKLDQVPGSEGQIVYTASKKFDSLFKLQAYIPLAPIRVKEQFSKTVQICYPHNLGHNIFVSGECKIDDEHFEWMDSIWMDMRLQHFEKKRKIYDRMIGNIECLEEWSTELPGIPLKVPQPYSFTRKTQVSLPLLKGSQNVTFTYKIRTKLMDLIRMRVLKKDGEYKEIKCNLKYLEYKSESLPVPEMWGRYSEMTDEERNWRKSVDDRTGEPTKQIIYTEDIDITSSKNTKPIGTTDEIPLQSLSPAKHIFWVAALVDGNYSNYTTNRSNLYKGWNPCAKSGIKYGGSDRVPELGHEHFDLSECYDFDWGNTPREPGYNVFTYTFEPTSIQFADTAVILKECGASLIITLGDTNPFLNGDIEKEHTDENGEVIPVEALEDNDTESSRKDKYIIHVRTLVSRKLEVYWSDKDNALKYNFIQ